METAVAIIRGAAQEKKKKEKVNVENYFSQDGGNRRQQKNGSAEKAQTGQEGFSDRIMLSSDRKLQVRDLKKGRGAHIERSRFDRAKQRRRGKTPNGYRPQAGANNP